jgi:hypothetical protein
MVERGSKLYRAARIREFLSDRSKPAFVDVTQRQHTKPLRLSLVSLDVTATDAQPATATVRIASSALDTFSSDSTRSSCFCRKNAGGTPMARIPASPPSQKQASRG